MDVRLKRAYEPVGTDDGYRVLVDRIWPRGVSKAQADLDDWQPQLAPSPDLRRWFAHRPERFAEFRRPYLDELRDEDAGLAELHRRARSGTVTLIYAAYDVAHDQAVVLAELLRSGEDTSGRLASSPSEPAREESDDMERA